jgi:dipeptidase E
MAQLLLLGSGINNGSDLLDTLFAHLLRNRQLLYLPIAQYPQGQNYLRSYKTLQSIFRPLGVHSISMWDTLTRKTLAQLMHFKGLYIGGGNTYKLLHDIDKAGFDDVILQFLAQDGIVYGASAGAIILGRSIDTAAHLDRNFIGQKDTSGLDLLYGCSVWPHYTHTDDPHIYNYNDQTDEPVIAISERTGLFVDDNLAIVIGHEPVILFAAGTKQTYPPSSAFSLEEYF